MRPPEFMDLALKLLDNIVTLLNEIAGHPKKVEVQKVLKKIEELIP